MYVFKFIGNISYINKIEIFLLKQKRIFLQGVDYNSGF
jgi:hypothetical protein